MTVRLTLPLIQRVAWGMLTSRPGCRPSIPEIAAAIGLSYRQFQRRTQHAGKSGRELRAWCCVTYAEHLIGKGMKCEAAMTLAGYKNHTHFNERYRRCIGCLPSESRGRKTKLLKAS